MSQITDLVINDGTADKTYTVISTQAGANIPAAWKNGVSAISANRIEASTRRVKGVRRSKAEFRFVRPLVTTIDGVESLVDTATISCTFTLPDTISMSDRDKLLKEFRDLLGKPLITAIVVSDSPAY